MTHRDLVVNKISAMQVADLDDILDDKRTYQDMEKETFIKALECVMDDFREAGDTNLETYEGMCQEEHCHFKCSGVCFAGNNSKSALALIIMDENDEVTDMLHCRNFKINYPGFQVQEFRYLPDINKFSLEQILSGDYIPAGAEVPPDLMPRLEERIRQAVPQIVGKADLEMASLLQPAHDFFHSGEFRRAIKQYHLVIGEKKRVIEAWTGIAASHYFWGEYELAMMAILPYCEAMSMDFLRALFLACKIKKDYPDQPKMYIQHV